MAEVDMYLAVLFKFLAASLVIERTLEFLDKIFSLIGFASGNKKALIRLADKNLPESDEKKRQLLKMLLMQTAAIIAGIIVCYSSKLGIVKELGIVQTQTLAWWDIFLSGILISGGTEPIHSLINFLKENKNRLKNERKKLEDTQDTVELPETAPVSNKMNISYAGGSNPKQPGHGLRKVNPKYIVIHHSGTNEKLSFKDIVKIEREERSNSRGTYMLDPSYHCVVTKDGMYHNYCRWDSVGWHVAKGSRVSNSNSIGICFVGNFETRKDAENYNTWDSNPRPTEKQIETGARMVALWRALYDLDESRIVPHRTVKRRHTFCPGSNFPMNRLIAKSTQLLNQWQGDKKMQAELSKFKKKNFIYVEAGK